MSVLCVTVGERMFGNSRLEQIFINSYNGFPRPKPMCSSELIWKWHSDANWLKQKCWLLQPKGPGLEVTSNVAGIRGQHSLSALLCFILTLFSGHMVARWLPATLSLIFWDLVQWEGENLFSRSTLKNIPEFTLIDLPLNYLITITNRIPHADCLRPGSLAPPLDGGFEGPVGPHGYSMEERQTLPN